MTHRLLGIVLWITPALAAATPTQADVEAAFTQVAADLEAAEAGVRLSGQWACSSHAVMDLKTKTTRPYDGEGGTGTFELVSLGEICRVDLGFASRAAKFYFGDRPGTSAVFYRDAKVRIDMSDSGEPPSTASVRPDMDFRWSNHPILLPMPQNVASLLANSTPEQWAWDAIEPQSNGTLKVRRTLPQRVGTLQQITWLDRPRDRWLPVRVEWYSNGSLNMVVGIFWQPLTLPSGRAIEFPFDLSQTGFVRRVISDTAPDRDMLLNSHQEYHVTAPAPGTRLVPFTAVGLKPDVQTKLLADPILGTAPLAPDETTTQLIRRSRWSWLLLCSASALLVLLAIRWRSVQRSVS